MFHSYVSLPEGTSPKIEFMTCSASEIEASTNMFLPLQIVNLWLEVAKNYIFCQKKHVISLTCCIP